MTGFDEIHWSGELMPRDLPVTMKVRWGFKSKTQLPLFMVWREIWQGGEVIHGEVMFNTRDWIRF